MQRDDHTETSPIFGLIVWPMAAVETIVWAAYYYSFPALLVIWENDLGWTKAELSGAFTLSLMVSAVMAPVVGRLIDRGLAKEVFAYGAALGALMLVALSAVTTLWQFYLIWFGLGVAMAATLYEACFSVLTRALGDKARRGITTVALVAGFAGTVSFPKRPFPLGLVWVAISGTGVRSCSSGHRLAISLLCLPACGETSASQRRASKLEAG